ncbi:MAG: hydrogenase expression/formation protein HypE [Deltaproteobacteria bacterium RIFOXYD12_FULL_57_12]|nr:MAG: hydrogenase expression/formation protein HypE [Deltaproteobacteria bacterium RIFOXYD12_FULL_57_12]
MAEKVTLAQGSGGQDTHDLVRGLFVESFGGATLRAMEDSALLAIGNVRLTFSTDSFVVDPIFFPGGDIGSLAVHGTVNDLAMRGARPLYLSLGLILEEGFPLADLRRIVKSIKTAADQSGVEIVAGDTKVVPAGKADRIFINTAGLGILEADVDIAAGNGRPGDKIILSGTMADHGATIICQQEGLQIHGEFKSDSAPLHRMVAAMLAAAGRGVHVLRDPTRGGVGTTLNELAAASGVGIRIVEADLPVREDVRGACELLGLDPLYLANEGKLLALVAPEQADIVLAAIRQDPLGSRACIIGEAVADHPGQVVLETAVGGRRLVDMLHGEALPRIC